MAQDKLEKAKLQFINQWGILGSAWGINRTMAQIQALLMASEEALTTDQVMEGLSISRGNAHSNLKELVQWKLAYIETKAGDRKEYFRGEKDPWKLFRAISQERQRREIDPTVETLKSCIELSKEDDSQEAGVFTEQMTELLDFIKLADTALDNLVTKKQSKLFQWIIQRLA
ncbi:MAG: GbsR/MarR family transcriptional regulator [Bacteroidales bacterium]